MKKVQHNQGFSLVEMLIYLAILTIIFVVVVNTILSFTGSYKTLTAQRNVENAAIGAMERMTRDIREATQIDSLGSSDITVSSILSGLSTTTRFIVESGKLNLYVNGSLVGPLTVGSTTVTNLTFTQLSGGYNGGVKIDLTLQSIVGQATVIKSYHSTVILRSK